MLKVFKVCIIENQNPHNKKSAIYNTNVNVKIKRMIYIKFMLSTNLYFITS